MQHRTGAATLLTFLLVALPCCGQEDGAIDVEQVEVGSTAPNFTVSNEKEELVELTDYLADNNVVLVFVRAHW